jgi:hypothetical protein
VSDYAKNIVHRIIRKPWRDISFSGGMALRVCFCSGSSGKSDPSTFSLRSSNFLWYIRWPYPVVDKPIAKKIDASG